MTTFEKWMGANCERLVLVGAVERLVTLETDYHNGNATAINLTPEQARKLAAELKRAADLAAKG